MMELVIKSKSETGEAREGQYAQRVVEGYEKDGSPRYRYFKTLEDYKTYLENKGKPGGTSSGDKRHKGEKKQGKALKEKVEREQADAKKERSIASTKQKNLFLHSSKNKETTKKSLRLYVTK